MRILLAALAGVLFLSGCAETRYAADHQKATIVREAELSKSKLNYILDPDRRVVKDPPQPIQPAYCYKNFGDIVCYKDPIPNARSRMVGYQEPLVRKEPNPSVNGFESQDYRDSDRTRVWNPYRNESGLSDAYVVREYPSSSDQRRRESYTVDRPEPVHVSPQPPVREFTEAKHECPKCPSCVKKAKKSKSKSKRSKTKWVCTPVKAKASGKKVSAVKKNEAPVAAPTPASVQPLASAPPVASPATTPPPAVVPTPTPPASPIQATANAPAKVMQPAAPQVEAPVKPLKQLQEIKYDKNAADPKGLIKNKQ